MMEFSNPMDSYPPALVSGAYKSIIKHLTTLKTTLDVMKSPATFFFILSWVENNEHIEKCCQRIIHNLTESVSDDDFKLNLGILGSFCYHFQVNSFYYRGSELLTTNIHKHLLSKIIIADLWKGLEAKTSQSHVIAAYLLWIRCLIYSDEPILK